MAIECNLRGRERKPAMEERAELFCQVHEEWLFPSGHIARSAASIRSFTQMTRIRQKCSSIFNIFNANPAGPHRPLRFSMARPLRPYHPQRFIHQKLHPNRHTCSSIFHVQASSMRWLFPSGHITHAASSIRSCTQIRRKWSSIFNIFNAKPTGPYRPLRFSMVHLIPKPFVPRPTVCPPGWRTRGNRSVTKLPPGTWPGKEPCVVSRFPTQSN